MLFLCPQTESGDWLMFSEQSTLTQDRSQAVRQHATCVPLQYCRHCSHWQSLSKAQIKIDGGVTGGMKLHMKSYEICKIDATGCYRLLQAATGCYRLLQAATGCYRLLQAATGCYRLLQAATGCYRLLQAATGCYRLLQAATGCYRLLQFYLVLPILFVLLWGFSVHIFWYIFSSSIAGFKKTCTEKTIDLILALFPTDEEINATSEILKRSCRQQPFLLRSLLHFWTATNGSCIILWYSMQFSDRYSISYLGWRHCLCIGRDPIALWWP